MSYKNLMVWQLAREVVVDIHKMSLQLPKFEQFEEGSQIRRSVKSVKSNIVEGYGRRMYQQDYIRFLVIALASNDETIDHLETLHETGSLNSQEIYNQLHSKLTTLGIKLNNFLQAVQRNHQKPSVYDTNTNSVREDSSLYQTQFPDSSLIAEASTESIETIESKESIVPKIRVGQGYDVHRLEDGRPFWLGGIQIPSTFGPVGHSDADVVCHVLCDALLGAANMRNIGYHFSDKDPRWKGVDSKLLLAEVLRMVRSAGYEISNVDVTVVLQEPKLNPHIPAMKTCLAEVMAIPEDDISIKATTSEHIGFVGRGEGIAAHCVALIVKD